MQKQKRIFYIVNADWFFLSHRLDLAIQTRKKGYEVYVLTKNTGLSHKITNHDLKFIEIDFDRSGTNPFKDIRIIFKIRRLIKKFNPTFIHNVTIKPIIYGSIAAKKTNTKIVNAVSGLGYNFIGERKGITQKVLNVLLRFSCQKNVAFIFQNEDDKKLYEAKGLLKNNFYKMIRGSGVNIEKYNYTPPIKKDKLNILVSCRMLYDKGVIEFIAAAKILKPLFFDKVIFTLIGGIDKHNKSGIPQDVIEKETDPNYIEWLGHQNDVKPYLIKSDIYCLLSYREGMPKSILEAMAIGRPIVTTNVPGCKACVIEGENGFLVEKKDDKQTADAIQKLLIDESLRLEMGKKSRAYVEQFFSLKKVIQETHDFYDELLA